MTADEFEKLKEGTTEQRDAQVRQVSNGFVFVANRRFNNADTGTQNFSLGIEGVAADVDDLLGALGRFFKSGDPSGEAAAAAVKV
jgi:hypothetical protein